MRLRLVDMKHRGFTAIVLGHGDHCCHLGPNQHGHVDFIDGQVSDCLTSISCFFNAFLGKWNINPAGEKTSSVPHGLAVTHQNEQ